MLYIIASEVDDDTANLEWALKQSKWEYDTHQELLANAAVNSEEEEEAVEQAKVASQQTIKFDNAYSNSEDRPNETAEEIQECSSPGLQLVFSSGWSSRDNASRGACTPKKSKKDFIFSKNNSSVKGTSW